MKKSLRYQRIQLQQQQTLVDPKTVEVKHLPTSSSPKVPPFNDIRKEPWPNEIMNLPNYSKRDLSGYDNTNSIHGNRTFLPQNPIDANCLPFTCNKNVYECSVISEPTSYDGTKPPCCVHILRDMAREFDKEMSFLGLDYAAAFGTLLGYRRSGTVIPWTIDNDYIIESSVVANAMVDLWNSTRSGLVHLFQGINRACVTPNFAGGKLQKWQVPYKRIIREDDKELYKMGFPYIDLYVGKGPLTSTKSDEILFSEITGCLHHYEDVFPTKRISVYGGDFAQNIPANTDKLLEEYYGGNWHLPSPQKAPNGGRMCAYVIPHKSLGGIPDSISDRTRITWTYEMRGRAYPRVSTESGEIKIG